jgi:PTS system mannose-specific IID component
VALALFGLGAGPLLVVGGFLLLYNIGHVWLLIWGLRVGWREGLRVAPSLGTPILRHGPQVIGRAAAALGVLAVPLIFDRIAGSGPSGLLRIAFGMLVALAAAVVLVRLQGRLEGWKAGLIALTLVALYSTLRP